jgi:putative zinc finger protein
MKTGAHPGAETTAAWLDGTLAAGERDAVEAHLAGCDECRSGVALLRLGDDARAESPSVEMLRRARDLGGARVLEDAQALDSAPNAAAHRPRRRFAIPAALAATLLVAGALALWLGSGRPAGRGPDGRVPVERSEGPAVLEALSPAGGRPIEAARLAFDWRPAAGADRYVVTILDAGGSEVAAFDTRDPGGHLAWPADRPPLPSGTYLWSVRALALDRVLAETRPAPFEVR